ncbi:MAG: LPS-assembly protein LptD [Granulosicoccus sp.]
MLCVLSACTVAEAALCPAPAFVYSPEDFASQPGVPVTAEADSLETNDGVVTLEGNTVIEYLGRKLTAQNALYNQKTGELSVEGPLSFLGAGVQLESNDAFIDIDDDLFTTGESEYQLDMNGKRATGTASAMEGLPNGDFSLTDATYSTCPPGDRSWYVKADSLELYPSEGIGTARNLRLVFKGVPLLAVPAFSFPISDMRKTGFLAPILARRDTTGLELHLPWYWNIRPDADATFTPRFMTKRGVQLQSELRYLNRQGKWTLDHEYLRDRELNNDSRYFTELRHNGRFNAEFTSEIIARRVSDKDYLEDLGDGLQLASITHLEQRADLNFEKGRVRSLARLQGFQTVDEDIAPEDRPHARLPQIKVEADSGRLPLGLRADVVSEFVYFDKDDAVTGVRMDVRPRLTLPLVSDAWFFRPSVSHRFTYYSLNNNDDTLNTTRSRNLNSVSVDSGLFFDRLLDDRGSIQTLEPRLFYLRVPFTEQSDIQVFDSSAFDFNISQLFRDNRFSGADRVADANQLSMALTTRMIDGVDGRDLFRASIGQIHYFDDRRVTLPPQETIETRDTSDFVGEVYTTLTQDWIGKGSIQWNPDETSTVRSSLALGYRPSPNHIANVAHRVVKSEISQQRTEQIDLSALWKFNESWRIAGRWNYSLDADQSIETLMALEYESCCWAVRIAARRYIADGGDDHDSSVALQLVLKGLAPLGQNYGALLENAVTGYRDTLE